MHGVSVITGPILFLEGIRTYIVVTDSSSTTREVGTTKRCQQLAMQMLIGLNMQVEMSMDNVLRSWIAKGTTKYCIEISLSHNAVALVFVCGRYFHPLSAMGMPHSSYHDTIHLLYTFSQFTSTSEPLNA
jgi:hypothetical protein